MLSAFMAACSLAASFNGLACGDNCDAKDGTVDGTIDATSELDGTVADTPDGGGMPNADGGSPSDGGNTIDAFTPKDSGAPVLAYTCNGNLTKVADCTGCPGATFPCVLCANNGSDHSQTLGFCVSTPTSSACEGRGPATYDDCICAFSPAICAQPYNVCVQQSGPACRTCGFDGGVGLPCKGGGTCKITNLCN